MILWRKFDRGRRSLHHHPRRSARHAAGVDFDVGAASAGGGQRGLAFHRDGADIPESLQMRWPVTRGKVVAIVEPHARTAAGFGRNRKSIQNVPDHGHGACKYPK